MIKGIYAPNLLVIDIDENTNGDYKGRLYNQYDAAPERFKDSVELLRKMESFFDQMNFPQSSMHIRTFQKDTRRRNYLINPEDKKPIMSEVEKNKGDKGTFIVQVMYRQNATWQGQVIWAEQNKKVYFRSAMELLKLIDSALEKGTIDAGAGSEEPPKPEEN